MANSYVCRSCKGKTGLVKDNKLVIITKFKTFYFVLHKDVDNNIKNRINFIVKHNEFLAENTIKIEISQLVSHYKHKKYIYEHRKK